MSSRVPEVEMWNVSKSCRKTRESLFAFAPKLPKLSFVNYQDLYGVDSFYMECQKHRDYYRDPYDKLLRPQSFVRTGRRPVKPDLLSMPMSWHQESKPLVFPMEYGRHSTLGRGFQMVERNSRYHDTFFLR
ncbi:uncharacterized protein LOC111082472 [Drosophila obscura]|uniref:uncharacterized protein LOC111082472 n=1 Tax=Drosophila obscura TaxID=7282 RepID=UPI001BB2A7B5|nr:uncharacterized protein LOC111082472 [Drosophila obscura]